MDTQSLRPATGIRRPWASRTYGHETVRASSLARAATPQSLQKTHAGPEKTVLTRDSGDRTAYRTPQGKPSASPGRPRRSGRPDPGGLRAQLKGCSDPGAWPDLYSAWSFPESAQQLHLPRETGT